MIFFFINIRIGIITTAATITGVCVHTHMHTHAYPCHDKHVEVGRGLCGDCSLLPGYQAWQQAPLPTEPYC